MEVTYRLTCRSCGSKNLIPVFSLGNLCLCNTFVESSEEQIRIPLDLIICDVNSGGCGLLQLRYTTPSKLLYQKYWYRSGISTMMRVHLRELINKTINLINIDEGDIVLDIGCNDGTMLRSCEDKNVKLVGFEPNDLYKEAEVGTTKIIHDYFNYETFKEEFGGEKAKVITSIAMFYDLEDPNKFVADIKRCLDQNGLWVIEMHYLPLMLETNGFDAIVHEHLEYYSMGSLKNLLKMHDLEPFDVELNGMNGGSFRIYVRHKGSSLKGYEDAERRLRDLEEYERGFDLNNVKTYQSFWTRITEIKRQLGEFIEHEVKMGKKIFVYGASTKGNAALQFFGLDAKLIEGCADKNPDKCGKKTAGTLINIMSPEQALKEKPDYFLVLIWHLADEIKMQLKDYTDRGGKLIFPLPKLEVYPS